MGSTLTIHVLLLGSFFLICLHVLLLGSFFLICLSEINHFLPIYLTLIDCDSYQKREKKESATSWVVLSYLFACATSWVVLSYLFVRNQPFFTNIFDTNRLYFLGRSFLFVCQKSTIFYQYI